MITGNHNIELISKKILGDWYNQIGSTLHILNVNSNGLLTGHYRSPLGTKGEKFQLHGVLNCSPSSCERNLDIVISFTVRWDKYGTITAWTGFLENKENTLFLHLF